MVDDKTPNLQMPLPHPSNLLGEDVLRLVQALQIADATIKALQTAMAAANQSLANHGHSAASASAAGFMSATDKAKLDGIAAGANAYSHPATHPPSIIAQDANNRFMTDAERTKLAGIAAGANAYSHPTTHPPSIIAQDANNRFMTDAERQKLAELSATPAFAGSATVSTRLAVPDTRSLNDPPSAKTGNSITADFKFNTSVGSPPVSASATYSHILTVAGWDTAGGSGGWPSQVSFGDGIAIRQAISATAWAPWRTVLTDANCGNYLTGGEAFSAF